MEHTMVYTEELQKHSFATGRYGHTYPWGITLKKENGMLIITPLRKDGFEMLTGHMGIPELIIEDLIEALTALKYER